MTEQPKMTRDEAMQWIDSHMAGEVFGYGAGYTVLNRVFAQQTYISGAMRYLFGGGLDDGFSKDYVDGYNAAERKWRELNPPKSKVRRWRLERVDPAEWWGFDVRDNCHYYPHEYYVAVEVSDMNAPKPVRNRTVREVTE